MSIVFDVAKKEDINELIRMRIAYMIDNFGSVSDREREEMKNLKSLKQKLLKQ